MSTATQEHSTQWTIPPHDVWLRGLAASGIIQSRPEEVSGHEELLAIGSEFATSERMQQAKAEYAAGTRQAGLKPFVVKYRDQQEWQPDDAMIRFPLQPEILGSVAHYLGTAPRLLSADIWGVLPSEGKDRVWSQSWHRDPEDNHLVKVFLYLNDVDEETGPFEYVLGSHQNYFDIVAPRQYSADESRLPKHMMFKCTGQAGTLILADTAGLHRGGYGSKLRLSATWMFCTHACQHKHFQLPRAPEWANREQRYALGFA